MCIDYIIIIIIIREKLCWAGWMDEKPVRDADCAGMCTDKLSHTDRDRR